MVRCAYPHEIYCGNFKSIGSLKVREFLRPTDIDCLSHKQLKYGLDSKQQGNLSKYKVIKKQQERYQAILVVPTFLLTGSRYIHPFYTKLGCLEASSKLPKSKKPLHISIYPSISTIHTFYDPSATSIP